MPLAICCCCGHLAFKLLAVRSDCGVMMERSEGASKNCLHWEVRIKVCYSDIACSCMTQWETPEVPCGCYACTECMFATKLCCKYAGCRQPNRELRHLRACGQPHVASLQVAGPNVSFQRALQVVGPNVSCQRALQVVGPHVRVSWGRVGSHTRLSCKL